MKKSTKLLSVILAIVMLFSSMTVLASAAKTEYKTHENLEALNAYSPYGAVTRLSTEERTSMVFDTLDQLLGDLNLNPGQLFSVAGLSLNVDLRSINALCGTVDNVKSLMGNALFVIAKPLLGILADVDLDRWQAGMTRENTDQLNIIACLLMVLQDNAGLVGNVLSTGEIDLGVASSALSGVDLSIIKDIPGLIKGLIFPLLERKDDDLTQMGALTSTQGNGGVQTVLNSFVKSLFTKPQSTTSYKENAEGVCISNHTLPTTDDYYRYAYEKGQDSTGEYFTCYVLDPVTYEYTAEDAKFYKTEEPEGSGEYVYKTMAGDNLKYYENDSYWLPSFANALDTGSATLDLETDSAATLLYKFAPYVFQEMAPVVLNGSVKKALAQWFGASFTYVGEVGSKEVTALPDSGNAFFTQEQGEYLWEWSDYAVINGNHYYRFEDQIFSADLSNTNPYFDIINWDYKITDDFINEFIPASADGSTASAAGYTTVLQAANDFFGKVLNTVLAPEMLEKISWVKGDNSKLLENAKKAAREIVSYSPESIFGEDYNNGYYQLMMSEDSTNQEIVCGIAAKLIELLMPQLVLPSSENLKGQNVGALLAAILRELATQFVPTYNYDALIYSDYNTKTFVAGKDNDYWLDVCLTIGVDIGMSYLRNLADLGEDTDVGYKFAESKNYDLATFEQNPQKWEETIDWVIDWALCNDYEWTWKMENFVDTSSFTIDLANAQDPWVKLDAIFRSLLPVEQILNVTPAEGKTWLETALRDNFVGALLDLDIVTPVSMLNIPQNSVLRTTGTFSAIVQVVRDLLNGLLYKMAGGNLLDPATITSIDSVFNQQNIANFAQNLISKLYTAYQNGLLDVAMPFLNFFLGWSTNAQTMANPYTYFSNTDGYDYMFSADSATVNSTLVIRNDSVGSLLEHRQSDVVDQPYNIYITGITSSDETMTSTASFPLVIAPGASGSIPMNFTYSGDKAVTIEVAYYYVFKDGSAIGGEQKMNAYQYISNARPDTDQVTSYDEQVVRVNNSAATKVDAIRIKPDDTDKYIVASSLSAVNGVIFGFNNNAGESYATWIKSASASGYPDFVIDQTANYVHGDDENTSLYEQKIGWMNGDNKYSSMEPFAFNTNVDLSGYEYGSVIDLGTVSITWHNNRKGSWVGVGESGGNNNVTFTMDAGDIYYTDTSALQAAFDSYSSLRRSDYAEDANAEWSALQNALLAAARTLLMPFKADSFGTEYSAAALDALVKNLNTAYEALEKKPSSTNAYTALQEALDKAEPNERDTDYQDYELYEYWDYEEARNNARSILSGYQLPEAPDKYIDGCALSEEEINAIADAAGNATLTAAIKATMSEPTEADMDAYEEALANYVAPEYSALNLDDAAAKLGFYKQFLIAKTTEKQFLAKEIAAADAQKYVKDNYSADSWAAYEAALANANKVNSDPAAKQSVVFDAKYELMIARNNLMEKADSAKDQGAYMQLESLIAQADVMLQNTDLYTVKEGDAAKAWANLVAVLGYEYEAENGETANLYANSAKAFVAADRVMSSTAQNQIDAKVAELQAAINQFTCSITLVPDSDVPGNETHVEGTEMVVNGLDPATINSEEDLLALVEASAPEGYTATLESVASAAGYYGTGATIRIKIAELDGQTVATYTVVIYGDVNGDGAVDAFDAAVLDLDLTGKTALTGAYNLAADTNADADVAAADYALVKDVLAGTGTINQVR